MAAEKRADSAQAMVLQDGKELLGSLLTPVDQSEFLQCGRRLQCRQVAKPLEVLYDDPTQHLRVLQLWKRLDMREGLQKQVLQAGQGANDIDTPNAAHLPELQILDAS